MTRIFAAMLAMLFIFGGNLPFAFAKATKKTGDGEEAKTVRQKPNRKKLEWDIEMKSKSYFPSLIETRKKGIALDNDPQIVQRLNRVLDRLKRVALIPDLPFEVHYVDTDTVNAFCAPGGGIVFFRGLFDPKEGLIDKMSDDEIAAIMGHEMAHATLRHSYRSHKTAKAIGVAGTVASVAINIGGGEIAGQVFDSIFDAGTGFYFPAYSRDHESEADLEGLFMMMEAGYNPETAIRLWERASKKSGKNRNMTNIFALHPADGQRAKKLRMHLENIKNTSSKPAPVN